MIRSMILCLLILGVGCEAASAERVLKLADSGHTEYVIVCAADASPAEHYAAQELADYLKQITGATFEITTDIKTGKNRIVVGPSKLSRSLLGKKQIDSLGDEEFIIRTSGSDLVLVGGRPRGTLYAAYHLLDNILGVRWWAWDATYVPHKPKLLIKDLNIRKKPKFEYRAVLANAAWEPDWAARNRLNDRVNSQDQGTRPPDEQHGGGVVYSEKFVHTFDQYVPVDKYLEAHPEWFSLVNGKRVGGQYVSQLCLTNPELLDFMVEQVKADLQKNPEVNIISVSQNDNYIPCQCENCKKVDEEEGSQAGTLIRFVNAVAERIEKEYPDVAVDTLAYFHTQRPPKITRPRHNVIVRLCSIKCSFAQPLSDTKVKANKEFADDLRAWSKVCNRLYIWDYTTNFGNYLRPYPNLRVLGPNVRLFANNNVKGVFEQGSYKSIGAEFQELRTWVLSRLLWNPNQDDRALINEFVEGYYGDAAPFIRKYIDLIHDSVPGGDYHLSYGGDSDPSPFINVDTMYEAEKLFIQAEAAVANQPEILNRVRRAHMPVQCMWLQHYKEWSQQAKEKGYDILPSDVLMAALRKQIEFNGMTHINEGRPISGFLQALEKRLSESIHAKASNSYGGEPEDVFDGDPASMWNGGSFGPEWVQTDLREVVKIKAINTCFTMGSTYSSVTYKIDVSSDGVEWRLLVPERTVASNQAVDTFSSSVEATFVRTTVISAASMAGPEWVGISEQTIETE